VSYKVEKLFETDIYIYQSVYAVSGTSRCFFSDKYKTHTYSVDRMYNF